MRKTFILTMLMLFGFMAFSQGQIPDQSGWSFDPQTGIEDNTARITYTGFTNSQVGSKIAAFTKDANGNFVCHGVDIVNVYDPIGNMCMLTVYNVPSNGETFTLAFYDKAAGTYNIMEKSLTVGQTSTYPGIDVTSGFPAIASIGNYNYSTLQGAIDAAQNGKTVTLLADNSENVTVAQAENVKFTIDGAQNKFTGTITVDGKSQRYETAGVTIQNFKFDATNISEDASINLGGNNNIRYTSNVTVNNCTFTGNYPSSEKVAIKQYTGGCYNLVVNNCEVTGMHSMMQLKNVETGLNISKCNITSSKNGISVGQSDGVIIDYCKITKTGYGIRADGKGAYDMKVTNSEILADQPIVVRNTTAAYVLNVDETNTLTPTAQDGYGVVITAGDDGAANIHPTGNFVANIHESIKVYPVSDYVASCNGKGYLTLQDAIDAAQSGQTITLLDNIEENVTINKSLTIAGAGKNYTGTMTISASINLTVENVNFVEGNVVKGKSTGTSGTYTFKNCSFTSEDDAVYAVELRGTGAIVIENCTSKGYMGMLQVPSSNNSVSIKNVTISNTGYAVKVDYSNGVTLENVTITGSTYGFVNSNYGEKTITVKICENKADYPIVVWDRNTGKVNTFKFEGANDFGSNALYWNAVTEEEKALTKFVLADVNATWTAVAGLTVTTPDANYHVAYEDGTYLVKASVAQINETGQKYPTLAEAIEAAQAGNTVTLLQDAVGAGVVINKDITIDLGGFTYTFNEGVGSTGTESNGFQILQGVNADVKNKVTIKNGTLNVAESAASTFGILVQNYADLTVTSVEMNGEYLDKADYSYVLSNNSGNVLVNGNTVINANDSGNAFAFNACKYGNYTEPVVTIANTVFVDDKIEAVAVVESDEAKTYYATLPQAVDKAVEGATVTLYADAKGAGAKINKDITIDLNGKTYTFNQGIGSAGTETLGFQLLEENDITIKNGTLTSVNKEAGVKEVKVLIQNYSNLTLTDVTLEDATNHILCALSNNSGDNTLNNVTITTDAVAFDVCDYASYTLPTVTVKGGAINGKIEAAAKMEVKAEEAYKYYATFAQAYEVAEAGNTITVLKTLELTNNATYNKAVTVEVEGVSNYPAFIVLADVVFDGVTVDATDGENSYAFIVGSNKQNISGNLTIKSGTYKGITTAVQVTKGIANIEGGEFFTAHDGEGIDYGTKYLLNCIDNADATFNVTGGKFYGFNPQCSDVDPDAPINYCAVGYGAENMGIDENGNTIWEAKPAQSYSLHAGWNWFSSYIDLTDKEGLTELQDGLDVKATQIKSHYNGYTNYIAGNDMWFNEASDITPGMGILTSLLSDEMYMINMTDKHEMQLFSDKLLSETAITIENGTWSWISYPVTVPMSVNDALSNLEANPGDIIKSHCSGYAQYFEVTNPELGIDGVWAGTLNTLVPGQGYEYMNPSGGQKTFYYNTDAPTRGELKANVTAENNHFRVNASQYPNNMTVTAVLNVNGEMMAEDCEIAAFVNGECRGSARPIYIEPLDAYMFFLTIHGDDVEEVTFRYIDLATYEEYALNERINYSNDAALGKISEPFVLSYGTMSIDDMSANTVSIYPNPTTTDREINLQSTCDVVEVFNALGVKIAEYQNVDTIDAFETAGIYVIRITNDNSVQHCRLIVK